MLAETEVFHRACASLVSQSIGTRLQLANIGLRRQVARLQAEASEATRLRTAIDDANRDARNVRAERDNLLRNLNRAMARNRELEDDAESRRRYHEQLVRDHVRLNSDLERLSSEVDRISRDHAARDPDSGSKQTTDLDDSEQRFRLLELDPLE